MYIIIEDLLIIYIFGAGGSGRTGMVIAAVVKNLGFYDPVSRIRRVKSTYVETFEQEKFLKKMPKVIDSRHSIYVGASLRNWLVYKLTS